jgi:hypothetical protein
MPLYMLGSRLLEGYPLVPLFQNQGVGIATFSYGRRLFFGVNADREVVPHLHDLVEALAESFAELCAAAGVAPDEDGAADARASG